jgi:hypothetical protein
VSWHTYDSGTAQRKNAERELERQRRALDAFEKGRRPALLREILEQRSTRAMQEFATTLAAAYGVTVLYAKARAPHAVPGLRQMVIPPITDFVSFGSFLHELGHCVNGPCPRTGDHYRKFKSGDGCLRCEVLAWETAQQFVPFENRELIDDLRECLGTYLADTPAPGTALHDAERQCGTVFWAEKRQRRIAAEIRADRQACVTAEVERDREILNAEYERDERGRMRRLYPDGIPPLKLGDDAPPCDSCRHRTATWLHRAILQRTRPLCDGCRQDAVIEESLAEQRAVRGYQKRSRPDVEEFASVRMSSDNDKRPAAVREQAIRTRKAAGRETVDEQIARQRATVAAMRRRSGGSRSTDERMPQLGEPCSRCHRATSVVVGRFPHTGPLEGLCHGCRTTADADRAATVRRASGDAAAIASAFHNRPERSDSGHGPRIH